MDIKYLTGTIVGNVVSLVGLNLSVGEVDSIISIVCSVIGLLITIVSIVLTIVKWWKKASEDNKITSEEIDELIHIIEDKKDELPHEEKKEKNEDGKSK